MITEKVVQKELTSFDAIYENCPLIYLKKKTNNNKSVLQYNMARKKAVAVLRHTCLRNEIG